MNRFKEIQDFTLLRELRHDYASIFRHYKNMRLKLGKILEDDKHVLIPVVVAMYGGSGVNEWQRILAVSAKTLDLLEREWSTVYPKTPSERKEYLTGLLNQTTYELRPICEKCGYDEQGCHC